MFALAWRSIWRQRTRSLAAALAVGFVVWLSLVYFGLVGAVMNGLYANLTEATGHLQVHTAGYRDARDFRQTVITHAGFLQAQLSEAEVPAEVVAALDVPALVSGETRARGVLLTGVDQPPGVRRRFEERYLKAGTLPQAGDPDGIALGGGLARTLKVTIGDTVYAYAPGTDGTGASAYTVVGLLDFPESTLDARTAVLSLAAAQDLAAPAAVSRLELHFPQFTRSDQERDLKDVQQILSAQLGGTVTVETWREVFPAMSQLERIIRPYTMFYMAVFFVLAGLLVVNTIYLSVVERTREFGVIIALGASRRRVMRMVLAESLVLCATGATVGLALGLASTGSLARGFTYPGLEDVMAEFGLPVLYASLQPVEVVITVVFVVVTALLAALWPARAAGRLEPVDAMRFVA